MANEIEIAAMRRAIALSAAGLGTTSPNPPVGCVVLSRYGQILGEGYHERKGEAHAEVQALAAAGDLAAGATAVVTLEPCNHEGRTPACRQALIDAGIKRVIVAVFDPTSRGAGGVAELRRAGVDVETGVVADEARMVLGEWLIATTGRRPIVIWPYLVTDNGRAPLPANTPEARALRLNADAVLRADGTVSEAIPGRHGAGILRLKNQPPGADASGIASVLYEGGVRYLLLDGGQDEAAGFLRAGLVDRVLAHMPPASGSRRPSADGTWPLIPAGFAVAAVTRTEGYVCVEGRPGALPYRCAYQLTPRWPRVLAGVFFRGSHPCRISRLILVASVSENHR